MTTIHIIETATRLLTAGSELFSVGFMLLALNFLANSIEKTYNAGHTVGHFYWTRVNPLVIDGIHGLIWINSMIDWKEVGSIVLQGLKVLVAFTFTATVFAHRALISVSEQIGRWYAARITTTVAQEPAKIDACWLLSEAGLSQRQIAAELGISRTQVRCQLAVA